MSLNIETISSTDDVEKKFILFTNIKNFLNAMIVLFELLSSTLLIGAYFSTNQNNETSNGNVGNLIPFRHFYF